MDDAIIDSNVLIVASLASRGDACESHRTAEECFKVFEWLSAFSDSPSSIVIDLTMSIYQEYLNKLSGQDFGVLVIDQKLRSFQVRLHDIEFEPGPDAVAVVTEDLNGLDRSDRKFLAVALADRAAGNESVIVNATDTDDWRKVEEPCRERGIAILQLLD